MRLIGKSLGLMVLVMALQSAVAKPKHDKGSLFRGYKGLVMAGYQGWFNTPSDGAERGWVHYSKRGKFEPGSTNIDLWPDVSEYKVTYPTAFTFPDGKPARVFSSHDASTVDLHFKWMKDYQLDGVFMQRFVADLKNKKSSNHITTVLGHALTSATKYKRAIAVMYDFSGMQEKDADLVISDWKYLVDSLKITRRGLKQSYLYHKEKPLVALWGVGFSDHRKYSLNAVKKIMDFLQNDPEYGGCSILLGVPAKWRLLKGDAVDDPELLTLCKRADIIHPWLVGRFNEQAYPAYSQQLRDDLKWCREHHLDYVPVVFPGFSWHNMNPWSPSNQIPRNKGSFYWKQLSGALQMGAEMIYVAMFDEVDEGTAIFKTNKNPPSGESVFVAIEKEVPNDYYLYLAGFAGQILKGKRPLQTAQPGFNR